MADKPEDFAVGIPRPTPPARGNPRGVVRVPFVRRCVLEFEDGSARESFLVNLNVLGAYITDEDLPRPAERMRCRFSLPDREGEIMVSGIVAWVNPQQQHPVHGLPRGFGLRFQDLSPENLKLLEDVVEEQIARRAGLPS